MLSQFTNKTFVSIGKFAILVLFHLAGTLKYVLHQDVGKNKWQEESLILEKCDLGCLRPYLPFSLCFETVILLTTVK